MESKIEWREWSLYLDSHDEHSLGMLLVCSIET